MLTRTDWALICPREREREKHWSYFVSVSTDILKIITISFLIASILTIHDLWLICDWLTSDDSDQNLTFTCFTGTIERGQSVKPMIAGAVQTQTHQLNYLHIWAPPISSRAFRANFAPSGKSGKQGPRLPVNCCSVCLEVRLRELTLVLCSQC